MGVLSVLAVGSASMYSSLNQQQQRMALQYNFLEIKNRIVNYVYNGNSWNYTLNDGSNASMACLLNSTDCSAYADTPTPFSLRDAEDNVFVTTTATAGFSKDGMPCNEFSVAGNDNCPIRVTLTWEPICFPAPALCVDPQVIVNGTFEYKPSAANRNYAENLNKYNFEIIRGGPALLNQEVVVADQKTSGTAGGACSGGWDLRTLNTILVDTGANVISLAGSVLTLKAGTYNCSVSAPAFSVMGHFMRVVNTTTGDVYYGSTEFAEGSVTTRSVWEGVLKSPSNFSIQVQHLCWSSSAGSQAFGRPAAAGYAPNETYTVVRCVRVN